MEQKETLTIAALTGGTRTASARFRFRQHFERLRTRGIEVREYIPRWGVSCGLPSPFKMVSRIPGVLHSRTADLVWLNKELVQGYLTFEKCLRRPRILDVDDAIWLYKPLGRWAQPAIARQMDAIIAGNDFIADYYSRWCSQIHIVPTAIDTDRFVPPTPDARPAAEFVIGWTGLHSNLKHLAVAQGALRTFLERHADARLLILSDSLRGLPDLPPERIEFVRWMPANEVNTLYRMSIGIMPLPDDDWSRGKCGFKMLQYMAAGLPVVVSPVGMNRQVLSRGQAGLGATTEAQWIDALETLYRDPALREQMGLRGRQIVCEHYSADVIAARLADIFRQTAGK